jgi:peptide/nickel transport system permease protein
MTIEAQLTDVGSRAAPRKGRRLRAFLRNPTFVAGIAILGFFVLMALFAGVLFPGDPQDMVAQPLLWPGDDPQYPLGTDSLGRDVLSQLVYGTRASLLVGVSSAAIGLAIGMVVGSAAGFFGGWTDTLLMRLVELFQTTPTFLLVIVILAIVDPSLPTIAMAIACASSCRRSCPTRCRR